MTATAPTPPAVALFGAAPAPTVGLFARVAGTDRDVRGLLLPYGEESRLSVSGEQPIRFAKGAVKLPRDPAAITLNDEHNPLVQLARGKALEDTDAGVVATFSVFDTDEGDAYLAALASEDESTTAKRRLSPELFGIVRRGAVGLAAVLSGAAVVTEGAWQSAALFAVGDIEVLDESTSTDEWTDEDGKTWSRSSTSKTTREGTTTTTTTTTVLTEPEAPATDPEEDPMTVKAPAGFGAAQAPARTEPRAPKQVGKRAFFGAIMQAHRTGQHSDVLRGLLETEAKVGMFALADATYDLNANDPGQLFRPQYLQEIWEGDDDPAERRIVPLFDHGDLTELWFDDSEWEQKAKVGRWDGNKKAIPSQSPRRKRNEPKRAQAFAGGLDIALEYKHFGHEDEIETFVGQMRDSFAVESDAYIAEEAIDLATEALYTAVPDVREVFAKLVQGMLKVRRVGKARPTFALLSEDMYEQYLYTPKDKVLEFLDATAGLDRGSFDGITFEPWEGLEEGQVLVGARKAAKVLELPGAPIRINALDLARGGQDEALFGYAGFRRQRAAALQLVVDELSPVVPEDDGE